MVALNTTTKYMLEELFDMSSGYVMDFTNASFADFVRTSIGIDPYTLYDGSKASILRRLWSDRPITEVKKLSIDLLDRWRTQRWANNDDGSGGEWRIFSEVYKALEAIEGQKPAVPADLSFLDKDFVVDLSKVKVSLNMKEVIRERLDEIERCSKANAPLAVIFLCGSTLEGILHDIANKQPEAFNKTSSAPKDKFGKVKPIDSWTLQNLIDATRELFLVGEDVSKHAHAVRDFRNYIHPRQQLKESFSPTKFTADMARQVLNAALAALSH